MIAAGVANPMAHGQATISTATALKTAAAKGVPGKAGAQK
jgi:hypothetical protein